MSRYIDADGLIDELDGYKEKVFMLSVNAIQDAIAQYPKADVAEVKHGRWVNVAISDAHGNYAAVRCSACKALFGLQTHYCPNCGAKMEEVEE